MVALKTIKTSLVAQKLVPNWNIIFKNLETSVFQFTWRCREIRSRFCSTPSSIPPARPCLLSSQKLKHLFPIISVPLVQCLIKPSLQSHFKTFCEYWQSSFLCSFHYSKLQDSQPKKENLEYTAIFLVIFIFSLVNLLTFNFLKIQKKLQVNSRIVEPVSKHLDYVCFKS